MSSVRLSAATARRRAAASCSWSEVFSVGAWTPRQRASSRSTDWLLRRRRENSRRGVGAVRSWVDRQCGTPDDCWTCVVAPPPVGEPPPLWVAAEAAAVAAGRGGAGDDEEDEEDEEDDEKEKEEEEEEEDMLRGAARAAGEGAGAAARRRSRSTRPELHAFTRSIFVWENTMYFSAYFGLSGHFSGLAVPIRVILQLFLVRVVR